MLRSTSDTTGCGESTWTVPDFSSTMTVMSMRLSIILNLKVAGASALGFGDVQEALLAVAA